MAKKKKPSPIILVHIIVVCLAVFGVLSIIFPFTVWTVEATRNYKYLRYDGDVSKFYSVDNEKWRSCLTEYTLHGFFKSCSSPTDYGAALWWSETHGGRDVK
jgi:hypothetical protein